ncbi:ABC transporter substrate-binding protein [Psychrobacter pygoscelis]|uniref:ABC transporter substrate-binding protein n=1 Tax=Psychrobacter pygoscelis TaxID=2488563 RepID=UPI00103D3F23|nr:ABC transporter substrate-binding protein [Psychrobacter pygoscelis]
MFITFSSKKNWLFGSILLLISGLLLIIHQSNQDSYQLQNLKQNQKKNKYIEVITPDWATGSTLTELGLPPLGIGDKEGYRVWVATPKLPQSVIDVGLRTAPNPELISLLRPDLIIDNPYYEDNRSIYDANTPVESITFGFDFENMDNTKPLKWSRMVDSTLKIGRLIERPRRTEHYIESSRQQIEAAGAIVQQHLGTNRKMVVANLYSVQQMNSFGINSTIRLATDMMGLDLVSLGTSSAFGVASIPLHRIYDIPADTCLIIMEPISPFVKYQLKNSLLWQHSRFSEPNACLYVIKPVWHFGGINVLLQFSNNLAEEVAKPRDYNLVLNTDPKIEESKTDPIHTKAHEL